jgi:hypothetical protein
MESGRYIGIGVNSLAVSLNGVIAIKMAREVFGEDRRRLRRLIILLTTCGLYALFASIHLRDALALVTVTTLTYAWVRYLARSGRAPHWIVIATVLASVILPLLRAEFFFVPIAMTLAGVGAILMFDSGRNGRRSYVLAMVGLGAVVLGNLAFQYWDAITFLLTTAPKNYAAGAAQQSGSLGYAIIVSAPFPLNMILKSINQFVAPIPVWTGFQLRSAYLLFKSFATVYFYFLLPLVILAILRVCGDKSQRTPVRMFLVFLVIGFTFAVGGTSGENRHIGAFLVSFQVLALVPDIHLRVDGTVYRNWTTLFVASVVLVHMAWAVLKFA